MKSKPPRPITGVDRMLAHEDAVTRSLGDTVKARRRTRLQFGKLEVILVETTDEPTMVYLANGEHIVEATAGELSDAAAGVAKLLSNPPPIKRRPR